MDPYIGRWKVDIFSGTITNEESPTCDGGVPLYDWYSCEGRV